MTENRTPGGDEVRQLFLRATTWRAKTWHAKTWRDELAGEEDGATAVEYALMLALIAMAIVLAVTALGLSVNELFGSVSFEPSS